MILNRTSVNERELVSLRRNAPDQRSTRFFCSEGGLVGSQQFGALKLERRQMIQAQFRIVRWPFQDYAAKSGALDDPYWIFMKKTAQNPSGVSAWSPSGPRTRSGKCRTFSVTNAVGMRGDSNRDDMEIVRVG